MTPKSNCCKADYTTVETHRCRACNKECVLYMEDTRPPVTEGEMYQSYKGMAEQLKPAEHPGRWPVKLQESNPQQPLWAPYGCHYADIWQAQYYIRQLEAERDALREHQTEDALVWQKLALKYQAELAAIKSAPSVKGWVLTDLGRPYWGTFEQHEDKAKEEHILAIDKGCVLKRAEIRLIEEE